jgi:hypothetical protein|nr:MAG TPA: DNA-binding protein [Caudoviricetes sp.]
MNNEQQNDWLATILYNPDKDYRNFKSAGLNASNTTLKSREEYLDIPAIQQQFKDSEGNFDRKTFDQFYDSANRTYNTFVQDDLEGKFLHKMVTSPLDLFADEDTETQVPLFVVQKVTNPTLKSQGINGLFGEGAAKLSMRQAAQTQKVFDTKTGQELDWTPDDDDKSGIFDFMFIDPLVEARWEEDGYHTDSEGRQIRHYAGDYKLNANGMPYYETLGDRDAANKNFLHWTDTLTTTGSKWEKYNFLASDGIDKSAIGTTAKLIATVAPMLIPYVGQVYGVTTGAMYFGQALSVFGKTLIDTVTDSDADDKPGLWKLLNKTDAFVRKFDASHSDEGSEGMFNYEQFATLISDVVGQLYQQRSIAKIPQWIGWDGGAARKAKAFVDSHESDYVSKFGKTLKQALIDGDVTAKDYVKLADSNLLNIISDSKLAAAKLAKNGSQFYMAMTQTKDMYDTFKESGFSDATTAIGMGAALYGFNKLFNTSLGEVALKGLGLDELKVANKRIMKGFVTEMKPSLDLVEKSTVSNTGKLKWIKSLGTKFKDFYEKHVTADPEGWIANSLKESLEEVSEEVLQDAIFEASNKMDWAFNKLGWTPKKGNYDFIASSPLERYFMSALGGAVGGAIFPAITKLENLRDGIPDIQKKIPEALSIDIATVIRNNGVDKSIEYIKESMNKGELGSTTLSLNLVTNKTDDGKMYYEPAKTREESQNNVIGNYLINFLRSIDSVISAEGYNLKDDEVIDNALLKDRRLAILAQNGVAEDILWDFNKALQDYVGASVEMKSAGKDADVSTIKRKQTEAKQRIDDIVSGKKNGEYVEMMAFRLNRSINTPFVAPDIYAYSKYAKGLNYSTATEQQKKDLEKEYEGYVKMGQKDKFNLGFQMWKNMKADVSPSVMAYRDSKVSQLKKEFYRVVEELGKSQGISELPESDIEKYKDEVRGDRTNDQIIAENNLNPRDNALTEDMKSKLVDEYLNEVIWKDDGANSGKAYKAQAMLLARNAKENMVVGVNPILNQRRTGQLSLLFESVKNLVSQTGFMDSEIKDMVDTVVNGYNKFSLENFINHVTSPRYLASYKGFTFEDTYGDLVEGSTYIGTNKEVSEEDLKNTSFGYDESGNKLPPKKNTKYFIFEHEDGNYALTLDQVQEAFKDMVYTEFEESRTEALVGHNGLFQEGKFSEDALAGRLKDKSDIKKLNSSLLEYLNFDADRVQLIGELDSFTKMSVVNNPMWDMLSTLSVNLSGEDVFKLLKGEEANYTGLNSLYDYVISNSLTKEQLQVASAAVTALTESILPYLVTNTGAVNFIDITNRYKKSVGQVEDIPLTQEEVVTIQKELEGLNGKIKWLIAVSDMNSLSKTADSSKTMSVVQSLFAKILSGNVDDTNAFSKFKNIKYKDEKGNEHALITDELLTGDELNQLNELYNSKQSDAPALTISNDILFKVSKGLYDRFSGLDSEQKESILAQLASGDIVDYNRAKESRIKSTSTLDDLKETDVAQFFIQAIAVDPAYSQRVLKQAILDNQRHAPFYNQMLDIQEMFAFYKAPEIYNTYVNKVNELKPYVVKENVSHKDIMIVRGGAGTGKSTGVALNLYNMIKIDNPKANIMIAGSKEDVADRLKTVVKANKSYDRVGLLKALFTEDAWKNKILDAITTLRDPKVTVESITDAPYLVNSNPGLYNEKFLTAEDINFAAVPDVLFIDEFTHFTGLEMQMIRSINNFLPDGKRMLIYGFGDTKQEGVLSQNLGELDLQGALIETPVLLSSIRANNVHKKDNLDKVSAVATAVEEAVEQASLLGSQARIDRFKTELSKRTTLKYYEEEIDGAITLHGDKLADESALTVGYLRKLAKGLGENERMALITDNVLSDFRKNVFSEIEKEFGDKIAVVDKDKIVVVDSRDVQGSEYKYTITDVGWSGLDNTKDFSKNLKYFYTLMSRSADGNIFVKKDRNIVGNAERVNTTSTSELKPDDISKYKSLMLEVIRGEPLKAPQEEALESGDANVAPTVEVVEGQTSDKVGMIDDKLDEQTAYNRAKEKDDKEVAAAKPKNGYTENSDKSSIAHTSSEYEGLKASTFQMNSFYNHTALRTTENGTVEALPITNNISEDLQGFSEFISGKTLEDIRMMELYGMPNVDLLKSLATLRSLFMRNKSDITQLLKTKLSLSSDYYKTLRPFIERYFDGDPKTKFNAFRDAIMNGNFLLKLTKFKEGFDNAHNVENFEPLEEGTLFSRVVFQINTNKGLLDITLGSTSSIKNIITNSGNENLVNILKDRKTLSSKIDAKGQVYYRLSDFSGIKTNIEYGQDIYHEKGEKRNKYKWLPEVRNKFNRGYTLDKVKHNHPELQFSTTYYDAAYESDKTITKGYPVVFISDDLWGQTPGELLGKHVSKIDAILAAQAKGDTRPPRDLIFGVSKGALNMRGLTMKEFFTEWKQMEDGHKTGGRIYRTNEFGRLARPVEAARFLYSMASLQAATVEDVELYNKSVDEFNNSLVFPAEEDWRKVKIAVGEDGKVDEVKLKEIQDSIKAMLADLENEFPQLRVGALFVSKAAMNKKLKEKTDERNKSTRDNPYSIKKISDYPRMPVSTTEVMELFKSIGLMPGKSTIDRSVATILKNFRTEYVSIDTLLEKLTDPENDIWNSDKMPVGYKNGEGFDQELKNSAIRSFTELDTAIKTYPIKKTDAIIPLVQKGFIMGFTNSHNVIRRLLYNNLEVRGSDNMSVFLQAIDYAGLYNFGVWTNGLDSSSNVEPQQGYYMSPLWDSDLYFDGPIQAPNYYIDYDSIETTEEYEVNKTPEAVAEENPETVVGNPTAQENADNLALETSKKELQDIIRSSIENNVSLQTDEVLGVINAAIESDIEPVGKTLEERRESYKSQLISKARENLSVMPRKVFVNSQGIASITPTYYLDNDLQVRPDIATEESMSDFITKEELLKKTPIASVMLKPEDIKFNESDGTFSIKVNRITYTYRYDGEYNLEEVSESEDPVVYDVAKEFEKYSGILTKGIEDVIKEGSRQVDVTKMSPKERIAYNKSAKLASFFNSLTPQQLSDILNQGFAAPESSYLDLIEQVTGALDITPEMKSADGLLSALRTNYTTNKDGKSNC